MSLFEDIAKARHKNYYPSLTGLRGIAALWVFVFHIRSFTEASNQLDLFGLTIDFSSLFSMGGIDGVHIFFVLSGFLLSIPFIRWLEGDAAYPPLGKYYIRRVLRVFPAYYAQLFCLLLAAYFWGNGWPLSLTEFVLHLLMFLRVEPWFINPLEGVWWTLPTEFSFYLVLPLFALLCKRIGIVWGVILAIMLTVLFRYMLYQTVANQGTGMIIAKTERFPGHFSLFVIGMGTSYLFYRLKKMHYTVNQFYLSLILAIGLFGIYFAANRLSYWAVNGQYFSGHYSYFVWNSANAIFLACVIFVAANQYWLCRWLLANRLCLFLGTISYSIYLWHFPVMRFAKQHLFIEGYTNNMQHLFISFPLVIIVSAISYQFVEAPAMRWGSKITKSTS